MLPVEDLSPQILTVDYCVRQLTQRLGLAAPAYIEKEGATHIPGVRKYSLQYDWRHDLRFGVWVGTWHIVSLTGTGEVCDGLRKGMTDVSCLLEVRWRGQGSWMVGCKGRDISCGDQQNKCVGGVEVMLKGELCEGCESKKGE